jgi:hypothetical protein
LEHLVLVQPQPPQEVLTEQTQFFHLLPQLEVVEVEAMEQVFSQEQAVVLAVVLWVVLV